MKAGYPRRIRILAIYPCSRGFAFAVLEDRGLVDWGIAKSFAKTDEAFLTRLEGMVDRYHPSHMAVEDHTTSRRRDKARERTDAALRYAKLRNIETPLVSRTEMRRALGLAERAINHELAARVAECFPELVPLLPRKRRLWESEAERIQIFQAVGLAVSRFGDDHLRGNDTSMTPSRHSATYEIGQ